jgi:hypothetical protein
LVVDEFVHGNNSGIKDFVYDNDIDDLILVASVKEGEDGKKKITEARQLASLAFLAINL